MLLIGAAPESDHHDAGAGHPECPERVRAALAGVDAAHLEEAVKCLHPRMATRAELERVHRASYLDALERFCAFGGGPLDPDTMVVEGSWITALLAAGTGVAAVDALRRGEGTAAFVAMRPPGHHATATQGMGFCLLNNVAVAAAALVAEGERVLIVDWDVHHGNGTQDIFWDEPRVLYVSTHQHPLYPGSGRLGEVGGPNATGLTVNIPLPPGATGDVLLWALDAVVAPTVQRFSPTWVLVSAGYDGHRADPLAGLALTAGDYADLTTRVTEFAPRDGRLIVLLEGGYDLDAVRLSTAATLSALAGERYRPEMPSSGGPGMEAVRLARQLHVDRASL